MDTTNLTDEQIELLKTPPSSMQVDADFKTAVKISCTAAIVLGGLFIVLKNIK